MPARASRRAERREPALQERQWSGRRPGVLGRHPDAHGRHPVPVPRAAAFALLVAAILGAGTYLAASVFLGPRDHSKVAGATPVRISMAGFDPRVLNARPGQTLTLDWWNTDAAMHLQGGVHTLVSDALNVRYELPAQSRETITITAPETPGDYDFWCDSCCGGKDSPDMHGTLHVAA